MTYREALKARIAAAKEDASEARGWPQTNESLRAMAEDVGIITNPSLRMAASVASDLIHARTDVELLLAQLERMEAALERKQQLIDRCGEAAFHIFQRAMLPHQRPNRAAIEIECNYIVQQARCVSEWVAAEQKAETLASLRAVLDAEEE